MVINIQYHLSFYSHITEGLSHGQALCVCVCLQLAITLVLSIHVTCQTPHHYLASLSMSTPRQPLTHTWPVFQTPAFSHASITDKPKSKCQNIICQDHISLVMDQNFCRWKYSAEAEKQINFNVNSFLVNAREEHFVKYMHYIIHF